MMERRLATLIVSTLAAAPVAGALTNMPAYAATTRVHTYKGATVNTNWGAIQVTITVKSKKMAASGTVALEGVTAAVAVLS